MKKIKFMALILSLIFLFSLTSCIKEQVIKEQDNFSTPTSAWQDYYGNLHVDVTYDSQYKDYFNNGAYIELSINDSDKWVIWSKDVINNMFHFSYEDLKPFIGQEISIYSRISSRNDINDVNISYNPSSKSTALDYTVKEKWDTDSKEYKNALNFTHTIDVQGNNKLNIPQSGVYDFDSWGYMLQDDPTIYYYSNIYYLDSTSEHLFLKKLSMTKNDTYPNGYYTLTDPSLIYEYGITTEEEVSFDSKLSDVWTVYNKTTGITVKSGDKIRIRIASTSTKCCSEIYAIYPFN